MKYFLCFLLFFSGCASLHDKSLSADINEQLDPALSYQHFNNIHIATFDPNKIPLILVKAKGSPALEKVSDLARRHQAHIATNGGFFKENGSPAGALKIDGHWYSKPAPNRGIVGWTYGSNGFEIIFDRLEYNATSKKLASIYHDFAWWEQYLNVLNGAPLLLIKGQKVDFTPEKTNTTFLEKPHARTALCKDTNNNIKLIVVEGGDRKTRALGINSGMTMQELADFLLSIGCTDALNLDGGYSSTFVKNNHRVSSFAFSFLPERSVANAIVVQKKIR